MEKEWQKTQKIVRGRINLEVWQNYTLYLITNSKRLDTTIYPNSTTLVVQNIINKAISDKTLDPETILVKII